MSTSDKKTMPMYLIEARRRAGFSSRGIATIEVPLSPETIGRHERGESPMTPEDALMYAKHYNAPDLPLRYCAACIIGKKIGQTAEDISLPQAVLRVRFLSAQISTLVQTLEAIAFDGQIDAEERPLYDAAMKQLMQLRGSIDALNLCGMTQKETAASEH